MDGVGGIHTDGVRDDVWGGTARREWAGRRGGAGWRGFSVRGHAGMIAEDGLGRNEIMMRKNSCRFLREVVCARRCLCEDDLILKVEANTCKSFALSRQMGT